MMCLSHSKVGLSMSILGAVGVVAIAGYAALGLTGVEAAAPSANTVSPYFGRWQVEDTEARFSARGKPYKMIDIAPCGRDFCGVSVSDSGACGPTLFRFLSRNRDGSTRLNGHGTWGANRKNVTVDYYEMDNPGDKRIEINLGNGHNFGERGGSMPMFNATYALKGGAQCKAR